MTLEMREYPEIEKLLKPDENGLSALEKMAINRGYADIVAYFGNREAVQRYLEKRKQKS